MAEERLSLLDRIRKIFQREDPGYKLMRPTEAQLENEPEVLANFMRNFQAQNAYQQSYYNSIVGMGLKRGHRLEQCTFDLVHIGDRDVLLYLYDKLRAADRIYECVWALNNKNCPEELLIKGMKDKDPEIREAAISNPNLSQTFVVNHAYREQDPHVQEALRERLGDNHPEKVFQDGNPVLRPFEPITSIGKPPVPVRKPSLADQVKAAEEKRIAMDKSRAEMPGKGHSPTPGFAPSGR